MNAEVEIFVLVDENGDWVVHTEQEELGGLYEEAIGTDSGLGKRVYSVKIQLPAPATVTVNVEADIPEQPAITVEGQVS